MTTPNQLRSYLGHVTSHFPAPYFPLERFVLQHGQEFETQKKPKGFRLGRQKQCFMNATRLALGERGRYVEGVAMRPELGIAVHHAWVVDDNDKVIDTTWRDALDCMYMGVVIPQELHMKEMIKHMVYGVLDTGRGFNQYLAEALIAAKAKAGLTILPHHPGEVHGLDTPAVVAGQDVG